MNWISHPVILEGNKVKLVPLEHDHFDQLLKIGKDSRIWEFMSIDGTDTNRLSLHLKSALLNRAAGTQYPFTIIDLETGLVTGSTMFHNLSREHRKLEIGWTWNDPATWRTGFNRECKLLMLTYCFEALGTLRVQFQTDVNNKRSQAAIEGLGAKLEGVIRNDRIKHNGVERDTMMYSIIYKEWPEVKERLFISLRS